MAKAKAETGNTAQAEVSTNAGSKEPEITVRPMSEFAADFASTGKRAQIHPFEIAENEAFLSALREIDFTSLQNERLYSCFRLQNTQAKAEENRKQATFLALKLSADNLAEVIPEALNYYFQQKNAFTNPLKENFSTYDAGESVEVLLSAMCPTFDGRAQRAAGEGKLSKQDTSALENLQTLASDNPATVIQLLETAITANEVLNNLKPVLLRRYQALLTELIALRDAA